MPKKLLTDLLNEMKSKCISDIFDILGHKYEMMLLNGEEADWRNKYVVLNDISVDKPSVNMGILGSVKKPTLAIGIRSIDGETIESLYEDEWDQLNDKYKLELMSESSNAKKWFVAERFLDNIKEWPDHVIENLWSSWNDLSSRREEAKAELKKSSGESEKKNQDSDQLSPSGDK